MFDSGLGDLGAVSTTDLAGLIERNHIQLMRRECDELVLAAAWADRTTWTRPAVTTSR
jgi:hypothetical protein